MREYALTTTASIYLSKRTLNVNTYYHWPSNRINMGAQLMYSALWCSNYNYKAHILFTVLAQQCQAKDFETSWYHISGLIA